MKLTGPYLSIRRRVSFVQMQGKEDKGNTIPDFKTLVAPAPHAASAAAPIYME